MKQILLSAGLLFALPFAGQSQLTITSGLSTTDMETLLQGLGVTISNVTINCAPGSYGEFSGVSEIPITHGLVISTGNVDDLDAPASTFCSGGSAATGSDPDLDLLIGGAYPGYDACVLEFDATPVGDTLYFNFAFGSEEYPEFVMSAFNDVFGIFISGPGFTPNTNIATLPGGTFVSIDNVNHINNSSYYIDNSAGVNIALDGFTVNLLVETVVVPGSTYHFKIAVQDVSDAAFDTGVMIEAFSFKSLMITGENELTEPLKTLVSPNPFNDQIKLNFNSGTANIKIFDASGKTLNSFANMNNGTVLGVENLEAGVYLLQIEANGQTMMHKMIKQ